MSEWKKVKLGDCCEITSSKRIFLSDYVPVGIPFYRSKEIAEMQKGETISDPLFISNDKYEEIKCKFGIPNKGDLLLTAIGATLGIPFVIKNNLPFYFKDGNLIWFKNFNEILDSSFLYTWMCSSFGYQSMQNIAIGSAQKALTISALKDMSLLVPPIETQHRIATILSRYDSLIENYQKQIKLLEESAQRLYKEWFIDLRFPGHENTKIVDGVPEGWEKKKVFELGKVVTGKTPSTANKANYGGDIPFITIPDMHSGIYPTCSQTLSKQGAESQLGKYIPENSLMVSCIGTAGLVCISETLCQTNQQINSLVMENGLNLYYMYFTFLSLKEHLNNIGSNGATMTNVNKSKFENIEVVVPIDSLLDSFNIIANNTFVKIKNLSLQIRHLIEARGRLLPKLMSGEIAV